MHHRRVREPASVRWLIWPLQDGGQVWNYPLTGWSTSSMRAAPCLCCCKDWRAQPPPGKRWQDTSTFAAWELLTGSSPDQLWLFQETDHSSALISISRTPSTQSNQFVEPRLHTYSNLPKFFTSDLEAQSLRNSLQSKNYWHTVCSLSQT